MDGSKKLIWMGSSQNVALEDDILRNFLLFVLNLSDHQFDRKQTSAILQEAILINNNKDDMTRS